MRVKKMPSSHITEGTWLFFFLFFFSRFYFQLQIWWNTFWMCGSHQRKHCCIYGTSFNKRCLTNLKSCRASSLMSAAITTDSCTLLLSVDCDTVSCLFILNPITLKLSNECMHSLCLALWKTCKQNIEFILDGQRCLFVFSSCGQ